MESSLDSILSDEGPAEAVAEAKPETAEVEAQPEQQQPAGEEAAPPAEAQKDDPIETHRKGLEAAVLAERRKRQDLEQQLQALQQLHTQKPAPTQEGPPDASQFENNPQEYWRQLARYEARQELQTTLQQAREQQAQQEKQRAALEFQAKADQVVALGNAKYRDFDAVINGGLALYLEQNPAMREALILGDGGHEVAYWLGKNTSEAARIAALPPLQMARELGRIESRMSAPKPTQVPQTLTQSRDSRGQFQPAFDGPTPLDAILKGRNQ